MPVATFDPAAIASNPALGLAGLIQDAMKHRGEQYPGKDYAETLLAEPPPLDADITDGPARAAAYRQNWNGGVDTLVIRDDHGNPTGVQFMAGRIRTGKTRGGATWLKQSQDGGKTWNPIFIPDTVPAEPLEITRQDETAAAGRIIASVEKPYLYQDGDDIVLGTCIAHKFIDDSKSHEDESNYSKIWDTEERRASINRPWELKTAEAKTVLAGDPDHAYKDGVAFEIPDAGKFLLVTVHELNHPDDPQQKKAVNAHTELYKLNETKDGYIRVDVEETLFPRGSRTDPTSGKVMDATCNRATAVIPIPTPDDKDNLTFLVLADIRDAEAANAAESNPNEHGDFDERNSCTVMVYNKKTGSFTTTHIPCILGQSRYDDAPALRYADASIPMALDAYAQLADPASLSSVDMDTAGMRVSYEVVNNDEREKSTLSQNIPRRELAMAFAGMGPQLELGEPGPPSLGGGQGAGTGAQIASRSPGAAADVGKTPPP